MKKQQQDTLIQVIRTHDDDFIKELNRIHTQEILPMTTDRAKNDATKNLPALETQSPIHFEFLTTRFNRLIVDFKTHAQRNHEAYYAQKDISEFKKLESRLQEKLKGVNNELRIKNRAIENLKSCKEKMTTYNKALVGIVLLSCSEAIFASSSFQIFMSNLLLSFVIGVTFAVALYYSATIGGKLLKLTKSKMQFIGILSAILLVIGGVFYTLGYFRLLFLNEMAEPSQSGYDLSPLQFMAIQLFFYICAILLKYFYLPEKSEVEQYSQWKEAKRDIASLTKQQQDLEGQHTDMEKSLKETLIARKTLMSNAADTERRIDALYKDSYQHYVQINLHHRSDSAIPKCFESMNILPPLTLYFQDEALQDFNEAELEDE
ncbi:hypothetical protein [Dokdonia sp.]|uniref:hypothetical protein n=1 Tax=Dokdonia sp. TaxID=2024995 RepID=UPI0032664C9A